MRFKTTRNIRRRLSFLIFNLRDGKGHDLSTYDKYYGVALTQLSFTQHLIRKKYLFHSCNLVEKYIYQNSFKKIFLKSGKNIFVRHKNFD